MFRVRTALLVMFLFLSSSCTKGKSRVEAVLRRCGGEKREKEEEEG